MKSIISYISILCVILGVTSCNKTVSENEEHNVFRYNEDANITSLDPVFSKVQTNIWACNHLFNGLVQLNDSLLVQPDIAKSWSVEREGLTYDFVLRNDVYFHKSKFFGPDSTRVVNAKDFEYSFNRLLDEKVASPGRWILQNVKDFKAINDTVFRINLEKPFPAFLGLLAMKYASVVPKEVVEVLENDFRSHPVGTGPFYFKYWEENVKLVLRKNTNYHEKDAEGINLPYLEAVSITFLPDKQSSFLQFIQGKLDFISGLDPSYKDDILTPKGTLQPKYEQDVNLITGPYLNTEYLGFRLDGKENIVKNKLIRQALNYGFDRKALVTFLRNGMGTPAENGFIPSGLPGFSNLKGYSYDLNKAKNLIQEYKKLNNNPTPAILLSSNPSYIDIAEFLQREWQKIGLNVQIDINPPSTLRQAISTGKASFFRGSWIADYPDAENYLSLFYSKNFAPNGPNYTHFQNDEFDELYENSFKEINDIKRYEMYQKMDQIIIDEAPVIPLFYDKVARFTRKNVFGLGVNPLNMLDLKRVKKM